jgi:multicomponent Na+:H+ antiporter subunit F
MTTFLAAAGLLLLAAVLAGLVRAARGPTDGDRMLAAQLLGTGGVGLLLILAQVQAVAALIDAALVLALLAALAAVAFVRSASGPNDSREDPP